MAKELTQWQLIQVEWEDTTSANVWEIIEIAETEKPCYVFTLGHFINEDENYLRLAPEKDDAGKVHGTTVIPKGCIKKITLLKADE